MFSVLFPAGPLANIQLLQIQLTPDEKSVRIRLQKYSHNQGKVLCDMVLPLIRRGMIVPHPSATWAVAPLHVLSTGLARL